MREILFRGKRADNGEWIEGQLLFFKASVGKKDFTLIVKSCEWDNANDWFNLCERAKVIPETVGQFTGLTDKNGTKIFEGDIIETADIDGEHTCVSSIGIGNCGETSNDGTMAFAVYTTYFSDGYYVLPTNAKYKNLTEVIGNIHDNPELLGGEA